MWKKEEEILKRVLREFLFNSTVVFILYVYFFLAVQISSLRCDAIARVHLSQRVLIILFLCVVLCFFFSLCNFYSVCCHCFSCCFGCRLSWSLSLSRACSIRSTYDSVENLVLESFVQCVCARKHKNTSLFPPTQEQKKKQNKIILCIHKHWILCRCRCRRMQLVSSYETRKSFVLCE